MATTYSLMAAIFWVIACLVGASGGLNPDPHTGAMGSNVIPFIVFGILSMVFSFLAINEMRGGSGTKIITKDSHNTYHTTNHYYGSRGAEMGSRRIVEDVDTIEVHHKTKIIHHYDEPEHIHNNRPEQIDVSVEPVPVKLTMAEFAKRFVQGPNYRQTIQDRGDLNSLPGGRPMLPGPQSRAVARK